MLTVDDCDRIIAALGDSVLREKRETLFSIGAAIKAKATEDLIDKVREIKRGAGAR